MIEPVFRGVAVALVTFFDDHGKLDSGATARHAAFLAERGVQAVLVAGSTGEAIHLSMKERLVLLDAVRAEVPASVPIVLGVGALPAGARPAELAKRAGDHGAAAAMALSPHYGDIRAYYDDIAAAASIPVFAYHFPSMSPPGIPVDLLAKLPVQGLKDSTGDNERLLDTLARFDRPVYVGSSAQVAYAGALGCTGAILAAANLEPELCTKAFAGDFDAQRALLGAHQAAGADFPVGLKEELHRRYGTPRHHRSNHHAVIG